MQEVPKSTRIHRTLQPIEMERESQKEIPERDAEQQRRQRASDRERRVPDVAPPRVCDLVAEAESDRPQNERREHKEHRRIKRGEGSRVEQRPGREGCPPAQDEPDLIALPDGLDRPEQRPTLLVGAPDEPEDRTEAEVEPVRDGKADEQRSEKGPPDEAQRFVIEHGDSPSRARQWVSSSLVVSGCAGPGSFSIGTGSRVRGLGQ